MSSLYSPQVPAIPSLSPFLKPDDPGTFSSQESDVPSDASKSSSIDSDPGAFWDWLCVPSNWPCGIVLHIVASLILLLHVSIFATARNTFTIEAVDLYDRSFIGVYDPTTFYDVPDGSSPHRRQGTFMLRSDTAFLSSFGFAVAGYASLDNETLGTYTPQYDDAGCAPAPLLSLSWFRKHEDGHRMMTASCYLNMTEPLGPFTDLVIQTVSQFDGMPDVPAAVLQRTRPPHLLALLDRTRRETPSPPSSNQNGDAATAAYGDDNESRDAGDKSSSSKAHGASECFEVAPPCDYGFTDDEQMRLLHRVIAVELKFNLVSQRINSLQGAPDRADLLLWNITLPWLWSPTWPALVTLQPKYSYVAAENQSRQPFLVTVTCVFLVVAVWGFALRVRAALSRVRSARLRAMVQNFSSSIGVSGATAAAVLLSESPSRGSEFRWTDVVVAVVGRGWPLVGLIGDLWNFTAIFFIVAQMSISDTVDNLRAEDNLVALLHWYSIGIATMWSWISALEHFRHYPKAFVLIWSLGHGLPTAVRFLGACIPVFLGYTCWGCTMFGRYAPFFAYFDHSMLTLFCVLNGDMVRSIMAQIANTDNLLQNFLAQVYMYTFLAFFIYAVLNIFLAIMEAAYTDIAVFADMEDQRMKDRRTRAAAAKAALVRRQSIAGTTTRWRRPFSTSQRRS